MGGKSKALMLVLAFAEEITEEIHNLLVPPYMLTYMLTYFVPIIPRSSPSFCYAPATMTTGMTDSGFPIVLR